MSMGFLFQSGIRGTFLILLVLCFRHITREHVAKRTLVLLWLAVLLRLLIPFSLPVPQCISERFPAFFSAGTLSSGIFSSEVSFGGTRFDGTPAGSSPDDGVVSAYTPGSKDAVLSARSKAAEIPGFAASDVLTAIWLFIAALLGTAIVLRHLACLRLYRESLPLHSETVDRWQRSRPGFRMVSVRKSCHVDGPLTYGLFRPVILLPAEPELENAELSCVLEHEWIHIRRWDVAVKYLMCTALCIYWFHPLVWFMTFFLNRDIELACDEEVLRKKDCTARKEYAMLLLKLAEKRQTARPVGACFTRHSELEERIQTMMKMKKQTWKGVVFTTAMVLCMTPAFTAAARGTETPVPVGIPASSQPAAGSVRSVSVESVSGTPDVTAVPMTSTAVSVTGNEIADFTKKFLGNPYRYGGTDLETGVDCSGFVQAIYKMSGIDLPRTMEEQAESGTVVTLDTISAGDLIFYGKSEEDGAVSPAHVAIYTGDGHVVHASNAREGIKMSETGYREIWRAVRIIK